MTMQDDGNLVLYNRADKALWASGTYGKRVKNLILQHDGHFCMYGVGVSP